MRLIKSQNWAAAVTTAQTSLWDAQGNAPYPATTATVTYDSIATTGIMSMDAGKAW